MDSATYGRVARVLTAVAGVPPEQVAPDVRLGSLGFDSLTLLEVGLALHTEFAVEIDDAAVARAVVVADLVTVVTAASGHTSYTAQSPER